MQRTNLLWDKYINYLIETIDNSKFMKRAESKPMSTPRAAEESHLTSRAMHTREVANVAKRLAEGLNLNGDYIYAGMLMHDSGHPFSAHEGEEIFSLIGEQYNCGFFHHNAKGIEVVRSEGICEKAIEKIPNINSNPELKKKLQEEFYYFLDVIISHDGEATRTERKKTEVKYSTMREAVDTKLNQSNSHNNYKFVAQTPEGKLAKLADVIAYLSTDIQDGFRIGVLDKFDDEYLAIFGQMFTTGYAIDKQDYILCAKNIIQDIKSAHLRELRVDMQDEGNRNILGYANSIIEEAEKQGIRMDSMTDKDVQKATQILEAKIAEIRDKGANLSEEEQQFINSDIEKLKEFIGKLTRVTSSVVYEVTSRMQEYFINDILLNSQGSSNLKFSEKAERLFDEIKTLNYKKIVQYVKWDYQKTKQPVAAKELIDDISQSLINSGAIRNLFYDRTVRKGLSKEELDHMKVEPVPEGEYEQYKKKIGIRTFKNSAISPEERYTGINKTQLRKYQLFKDVYTYIQKEGGNFTVKYKNVYDAIPTTVRLNVERALQKKPKLRDFLEEFQLEGINKMRERMISEYGSIEATQSNQEEFIETLIQEERSKMDEKMAIQVAIDYVSGMSDVSFNDLAVRTGYMTYKDIETSERGASCENVKGLIEKNEKALEEEKQVENEPEER